jgi:hypothetical protein
LFGALLLGLLARFVVTCFAGAVAFSNGFPSYYTASTLIREGTSPSRFYDDTWYTQQIQRFVPNLREIYRPNPPTTAFMLLPLCWMSYPAARITWIVLNALLLLGCIALLRRQLGLTDIKVALLAGVALGCEPVRVNFIAAQAHLVVTALWVLVLFAYCREQDLALGAALAALFLLKTTGVLMWPVLLVQQRWRALIAAGAFTALGIALSWPWVGLEGWTTYLRIVPAQASQPWISVTAHQSIQGMLEHLGRFDAIYNPHPLVDAGRLVFVLHGAVSLAIVVVLLVFARRSSSRDRDLIVGAAVVANLVLVPVSADYHYCVMLVPGAILLARLERFPSKWQRWGFAAAVAAISLDLHHNSSRFSAGWMALFAYAMLYGALVMLGLSLNFLWRSSRDERVATA